MAGDHVLADRQPVERLDGAGRDNRDLAGDDVGFLDDPLHAGIVVEVGVRVDHRDDGLVVLHLAAEQFEAGFGQPDAGAGVDDHEAIRSVDDGQSGAEPHLVEAGDDLVQPGSLDELGLAPQARVDRVGGRGVVSDVREGGTVVDQRAVVADETISETGDETAVHVVEVGPVLHRVLRQRRLVDVGREGRRRLRILGHGCCPFLTAVLRCHRHLS